MSALSIQVPFPVFNDRDGQPLDNGYVWIGQPNLSPQTNPVNVYFDEALTILAPQPLRTINGYISNSGTPAQVYIDGVNFSILVQDSKGTMVYNFPEGTGISPNACGVMYEPPFTGAVPTPVCVKLAETVSVRDFGATSGADTAAINAAITYAVNNGAIINFDFDATIRVPTDAPTIQKAIDAINAEPNVDITINIEAGHILTAGFRIDNRDCSYMTISSTDAVVTCSPSFALMSITDLSFGLRSDKNMFVAVQARMPRWNILVDASGVDSNYGIMLMQGSYGYVYPNKGIINMQSSTIEGVGAVAAYASQLNAYGANFSGCQNGVQATVGSIANCAAANLTNCSAAGMDVSRSSIGYCNDATISGGLRGIYVRRSWVTCQGATISGVTGVGIYSAVASHVVAYGVKFESMTGSCVLVGEGSTIDISAATNDALPLDPTDISPPRSFNQLTKDGTITDQARAQGHAPQLTSESLITLAATGEQSVLAGTYHTIYDVTGERQIVGGSVVGSDIGLKITIDGVVVLEDTARARGFDSAGEFYAAISIPPCASRTSLKLEVYNRNTSATTQIGWRVYRSQ